MHQKKHVVAVGKKDNMQQQIVYDVYSSESLKHVYVSSIGGFKIHWSLSQIHNPLWYKVLCAKTFGNTNHRKDYPKIEHVRCSTGKIIMVPFQNDFTPSHLNISWLKLRLCILMRHI